MTKLKTTEDFNNIIRMLKGSEEDISIACSILVNTNTTLPVLKLICKRFITSKRANIIKELCSVGGFEEDAFAYPRLTFESIKNSILDNEEFLKDSFTKQIYESELAEFTKEILSSFSIDFVKSLKLNINWNVTDNS